MSIPSSLLKKIYIANALGVDEKGKMGYDTPITIDAQVGDKLSYVLRDVYGTILDYDRKIVVPFGGNVKFINEQSVLWIDTVPNAERSNMDYKIERCGDVVNGNLTLYCKSLIGNIGILYYEYKNKIYETKIDFNLDLMSAIIPLNKYLPITTESNIWLNRPENVDDLTNKIKFVKKVNIGNSYRLVFKRVSE